MNAEPADLGLQQALRDSVAPAQKSIALALFPAYSLDQAKSRLSRILTGELGIPPALLRLALQGPNPGPMLRWFSRTARVEVTPIREPASVLVERLDIHLVQATEQLTLLFEEAREVRRIVEEAAEERRHAPLVKVSSPHRDRRERA